MKPLTQLIGQAPGNVVALVQNGKVVDSALFLDGEAQQAPAAAMTAPALLVTAWPTDECGEECRGQEACPSEEVERRVGAHPIVRRSKPSVTPTGHRRSAAAADPAPRHVSASRL
jgi:hypothetical protein